MCSRRQQARLESRRPGAPGTEQATGSLPDQTERPCSDGLPQTTPSPTLPGSVRDHLPRGPQRTPRSCLQSWGEAAPQPTACRVFPTLHSSGNPRSNLTMCSCDIKNGIRASLVAPQLRIGLVSKGTRAQPLVRELTCHAATEPTTQTESPWATAKTQGSKIKKINKTRE